MRGILFEREKLEVKPSFSSNFNANTSVILKHLKLRFWLIVGGQLKWLALSVIYPLNFNA